MRVIVRSLDALARAMNWLGAVAAVLMTGFVFLSAVMRYVVGSPLMFSDELVGLLFVTMAFLSMPLGLIQQRHISVDIVTRNLRGKLRHVVDLLATLVTVTFGVWFAKESWEFAAFSKMLDARSDIGALVLWPWMALLPACTLIVVLVALAQFWDTVNLLMGREARMKHEHQEVLL